MLQTTKNIIKKNETLYSLARMTKIQLWKLQGRYVPPPHVVKQACIKQYARKFSKRILIETGTAAGDMIYACRNLFDQIISIELDQTLYEQATERFAAFDHIHIRQGDSVQELPKVLVKIKQPTLFWLDGHYSGQGTAKGDLETPITAELDCIFKYQIEEHVILIDDARCFTGENDYPALETLRNLIADRRPGWVFDVQDDIIRIYP